MSVRLSLYDFFAYTIPGAFYLLAAVYYGHIGHEPGSRSPRRERGLKQYKNAAWWATANSMGRAPILSANPGRWST